MSFVLDFGVTGSTPITIQNNIDALNCPLPQLVGSEYPFPNPTQRTNATYNTQSSSNSTLTLTCTNVHTFNGYDYHYGEPAVAIGVFFFIFDYISEGVHKVSALFSIVFEVVTPPNSIPSEVSSPLFLFVYIPMYILLGFGIYKGTNPFG